MNAAADGTVETSGDTTVIRFERRLAHPVEKVWSALTEPEELERWLAAAELDLREGGDIRLRWLNSDEQGNQAVLNGVITRLDPPRLIEYEGDIHGTLRWELRADDGGCLLTFASTLSGLEGDMNHMVPAGWHIHLDFLEDALEGGSVDWPNWPVERWERYDAHYAEQLGRNQPKPV